MQYIIELQSTTVLEFLYYEYPTNLIPCAKKNIQTGAEKRRIKPQTNILSQEEILLLKELLIRQFHNVGNYTKYQVNIFIHNNDVTGRQSMCGTWI